jgi:hypothetical protein
MNRERSAAVGLCGFLREPWRPGAALRRWFEERARVRSIVIDELGYRQDVENAITIVQRGVKMVATVHGTGLEKVVHNPDLTLLLGGLDEHKSRRLAPPVFTAALAVRG